MAKYRSVEKTIFGKQPDGSIVYLYTLKAGNIEAGIITFGARIVSLKVPNRRSRMGNVVLGYSALDSYLEDKSTYMGATVGRYANRLALGKFQLDGEQYQISTNDHGNSLHGGTVGFDRLNWRGRATTNGVEMTLASEADDQGFPGRLTVQVHFTVEQSILHIAYRCSTEKKTVVNLTNHTYFKLGGDGQNTILGDLLNLPAAYYTPVDSNLIPTGAIESVQGTPFDFREATVIGARIDHDNEQLQFAGGYDHNWVLDGQTGEMKVAAKLSNLESGRALTVTTTEPGLQFYSGNFLDGKPFGEKRESHAKRSGLCLETQHFPDSPNRQGFPNTELDSGEVRRSATMFEFSTFDD